RRFESVCRLHLQPLARGAFFVPTPGNTPGLSAGDWLNISSKESIFPSGCVASPGVHLHPKQPVLSASLAGI
ncbi:MAG: hypothetical protein ACI4X9_03040, partial [Kiritimatiellia bacterium]